VRGQQQSNNGVQDFKISLGSPDFYGISRSHWISQDLMDFMGSSLGFQGISLNSTGFQDLIELLEGDTR